MRILILASIPKSLSNFRGALIETLVASGHDVHVGAPSIYGDRATCAWLTARGVSYHEVPLSRTNLNVVDDLRSLLALYRLMRKIGPDLVLAYTIKPVIWGMIAAKLRRVPKRVALITGLGYAFVGEARGKRAMIRLLASKLYKIALRCASLVFFQNPDDRDDFRKWAILPADLKVLLVNGSGVDTATFAVAPMPHRPPLRFLLIARLLWDKGIREYVQAARVTREAHPEAEFHLVGPIDTNPEAISETEVRSWEDAGILIWHGAQSDVRSLIGAAHVYVLPSYREGTPRSVLEAMSMGRPIITSHAPGCRETVIDGVNGFLVPVREAEPLALAMQRFIREPHLVKQFGDASRRIAEEKYDVHKVNAVIIEALDL
ncbi:glycosyltransferase family 4 protein [Qipengyuania nanhaisediminis]|uniref:Glycosyltransferase involved in cell wall bisynthesis n=1 Tax=Qipengyuania nanhaisediminis TaxID=604088 RepID=A0A1I5QC23_9SPHN|nr:glycosyltransferase family 4 protein [Qipengyuania nanhaisediminis]SFP43805.1 Glycosyltransferase involved in cell wall bisynthesis [Qipengyuania nanhaisediminis]